MRSQKDIERDIASFSGAVSVLKELKKYLDDNLPYCLDALSKFEKELKECRNTDWISCDERLPENGVSVLVWDHGTVEPATYSEAGWFPTYSGLSVFTNVKFWRPMLVGPEERE